MCCWDAGAAAWDECTLQVTWRDGGVVGMRCVVGEVMPRVAAHTGWQGECVKDDEALLFPLHVLAGMLLCADHTCPVATLLSPHLLLQCREHLPSVAPLLGVARHRLGTRLHMVPGQLGAAASRQPLAAVV